MGQYYMIANLDKKEFLYPHKMGSGLKLLEIAGSNLPRILTLLLQDSDGRGGGDGDIDNSIISEFCGRWAGDRIAIVGDYDSKDIYGQLDEQYTDISFPARYAYNKWMVWDECQLNDTWGHDEELKEFLKSKGKEHSPKEKRNARITPDMIITG